MAHLAHFLPLKNESVYMKRKSKDFRNSRAKFGPNGPPTLSNIFQLYWSVSSLTIHSRGFFLYPSRHVLNFFRSPSIVGLYNSL